jgi:thiopeptide-type bacteriocin biosynthesis protein
VKPPGSDWLYAKLYASPRQIQDILEEKLPELVRWLRRECHVTDWFFFRYQDPDWHLRLRVRVPRRRDRQRARERIESVSRAWLRREDVWRVQYETYFREVERSGGANACRWVERFFAVESELALRAFRAWTDADAAETRLNELAAGWDDLGVAAVGADR